LESCFPKDIDFSLISFEILGEHIDFSNFNCNLYDYSGVNDFIHKEALDYQNENLGVTYVYFYDEKIIAFATISMNSIRFKEAPDSPEISFLNRDIPQSYTLDNWVFTIVHEIET